MKNTISTIQLNESVKRALEVLKEKRNESYEDVIVKLLDERNMNKKEMRMLLKEQCEEMYDEDIRIAKEWEGTLLDGND